jgi:hypothetical protein
MKNTLTLLFLVFSIVAFSQVPQGFNYQGVARDVPSGQPKQNININVKFTILQGSVNGTPVYSENHSTQTNDFGLFTLTIGQGMTTDTFSNLDWSSGTKFLKVEIDNQLTGTTQLWSVPYALLAEISKSTSDWRNLGDSILFSQDKKIGINTSTPKAELDVNGSIWTTAAWPSVRFHNQAGKVMYWEMPPSGKLYLFDKQLQKYRISFDEFGKCGIGTTLPQRDLDVNGISRSRCVEVTGGCDIVENVNSVQTLQSGEVIVTDPSNPNQVLRSNKAYDRLTIGVVSGAGGITHGVMLSQEGVLDGNVSFAIAGRVKVKVVGAVAPGDLLTTSSVAGHAMVAKSKRKREGAIIGKALTIPDEQGLVLMLVTAR